MLRTVIAIATAKKPTINIALPQYPVWGKPRYKKKVLAGNYLS